MRARSIEVNDCRHSKLSTAPRSVRSAGKLATLPDLADYIDSEPLRGMARETVLKAQGYFAREGNSCAELGLIRRGVLAHYRTWEGNHKTVEDFSFPGDFLVPDLQSTSWKADAKALTAATVIVIPLANLERLFEERAGFGFAFFGAFGLYSSRRYDRLFQYRTLPVEARMAAFVLETARHCGESRLQSLHLRLPMGRDDMASYLGIRTETVSRVFTRWRHAKGIELETPRSITVPDVAWLEAIAENDSTSL